MINKKNRAVGNRWGNCDHKGWSLYRARGSGYCNMQGHSKARDAGEVTTGDCTVFGESYMELGEGKCTSWGHGDG